MVGIMVGFLVAEVGRVTGADVGEGVGFDGQLVMPSLKAQRALASDCCGLIEVGDIVGDNDGATDGVIVMGCPQLDVTGVLQS
jgi:hypothetical protein